MSENYIITAISIMNVVFYVFVIIIVQNNNQRIKKQSDKVDNIFKRQGDIEGIIKTEVRNLINIFKN